MTEAPRLPLAAARLADIRITASISAAHFVSHFYYLILPPLFEFIRRDYAVSYTELGYALVAFNMVSAVCQTPAGFLVDRIGARIVLIAGLLLGAVAYAIAGLVDSFWVLVAMFAVAGLGNSVYHPADYAVLSSQVSPDRVGQAFAIHTFTGLFGSAVAPASLLFLYSLFGWRGAFVAAGALGLIMAGVLVRQRNEPLATIAQHAPRAESDESAPTWQVLFAPVILLNFAFFTLLAFANIGMQNYSVVALAALHGTPLALGNAALSAHLLLSAFGVLLGGLLISRMSAHGLTAALCLAVFAAMAVLLGLLDLGSLGILLAMSVAGLASGTIMPPRDMIVRQVTPSGSFGKVFGFVTSGFNFAGVVAPLMFGALMDHGYPSAVFLVVVAGCLIGIATVATVRTRARAA